MDQRILIIDDDASVRTALSRAFVRAQYSVLTAATRKEALQLVQAETKISMALIDMRLPDGDGISLMEEIKNLKSDCQFIILTGFGNIDVAIDATRRGAFHFVTKPCNIDEVLGLVSKAFSHQRLKTENQTLRYALHSKYKFDNIIGQSPEIHRVMEMIDRVADSDSTVLITGESGTGKELVAKAIHYNSARSDMPFIPINCGAIPGELLESELFGHVKGAFTGAVSARVGRFELANDGTIFFDEIGDMSGHLQVKLLRVLQDKRFEPVGSTKTQSTNARIIAATNIDLENAVAAGQFREDLFYRLNVIPIRLPALRERPSDIPLLFHYFVEQFNQRKGRGLMGVTPATMDVLTHYSWPGNIRELENLVERLSILKGASIVDIPDLPERYRRQTAFVGSPDRIEIPDAGMDFNSAVDAFENQLILKALQRTGWNRNQAATLLKLNRTTLVEKIKKKGLRPPESDL